jgi:hypothetical protein
MNNVNGMIAIPVLTPYGTQWVPMPMNQLMSNGLNGTGLSDNLGQGGLNQLAQLQQQAATQQAVRNMQTLNMQNQLRNFQNTQNPIVSSILQQQAQILRNHQKLTAQNVAGQKTGQVEMQKVIEAEKAVAEKLGKSSKKSLGAIGDLRPMYRSQSRGQSSGFSSGNASESDSGSSSSGGKGLQLIKNANGLNLKNKTQSITSSSHFSSQSSGWSESGSGDESLGQAAKHNIKLLEQRSGSKSLFLQKMVEVLEGYFSDEGLKRNQFLAKQLQINPDGIPLKKVASMRRVKTLTRDLLTVASAVRRCPILELSRDGCLVRRIVKPTLLEPPKPIRTVLAINVGQNPTVESVTSAFAKYGELTQVRVIRPTSCLPSYLKEFTMWVPDLGSSVCAVIEFETQEEAQAACREINMANREEGKLRVALLKPGARIRRTLYRKYKDDEIIEEKQVQKVQKVQLKIAKVQSDSGHGSDGSNEASTENSEDENIAVDTKVITRRSWMSKVYQTPRQAAQATTVIRQPFGPEGSSRGFAPKHALKRRELLQSSA